MNGWTPDSCGSLLEAAGDTLRPGGLELTKQLLGFGNFQIGSRVLDAGCGTGTTLRHLSQSCRLSAVGVDSSEAMLAVARSLSSESPLICAPLEMLPFDQAGFDGIICECVLSATVTTQVLAEFQRVLCPGGLLLVSDLYRRPAGSSIRSDQVPDGPLSTREQTEAMLVEAGFTLEHWEDRTRDLKQLAVRLIMAPGSSEENLFGWCEQGGNKKKETGIGCKELGYHLFVARRTA